MEQWGMRRKGSHNRLLLWLAASAAALLILSALVAAMYLAWRPGVVVTDGRYDLGTNGIWVQHGWLGDDEWFGKAKKDPAPFRNRASIQGLGRLLDDHRILYVFPHLCPCSPDGTIPAVDRAQTELFLEEMAGFRIIPWVGGILGKIH